MSNLDDILTNSTPVADITKKVNEATFDKTSWAEQKQNDRDQAYKLIDDTANKLSNDGSIFKGFLDVQSKFDRYSVANNLLILAQNPEAIKLADYNAWKEKGTPVKKGKKGITILEPGEEYTREDGSIGVSYNTKKVFDVSQTSSEQTVQPSVKKDERLLLKALIHDIPVAINISDRLPEDINAMYKSDTKEILIRQGLDGASIFKALSQELAHAEMDKGNYNRNECVFHAYCVSYMLCKRNGFDVTGYSFDRLPAEYENMEVKDIRAKLSLIRDTTNDISTKMSKVLEPAKVQKSSDKESR